MTVAVLNYKFRLYPTRKQEQLLEDTFEVNRTVYNFLYPMATGTAMR